MADNTQLDSGSGGDVIATDDIAGVKHQRIKLEFGGDGVATEVDHGDPLPMIDFATAAAFGLDANVVAWNAYGYNGDFDTAAEECVTSAGGSWLDVPLTTAETVDLVSTDANDTGAGTGARTVRVIGLDGSWAYQFEDVSLNGTSTVTTTNAFMVVYRLEVRTVGSGGTNAGLITAQSNVSAKVFAAISAERGRSAGAVYAIREGATGLITQWESELHASGGTKYSSLRMEVYDTQNAATWQTWAYATLEEGRSHDHHYDPPLMLPERTLVRVKGTVSANNSIVSSQLSIIERTP